MTKEQIIQKLTSRKLWVSICAFVSLILVANGKSEAEAEQVTAIIMAGAVALGYILAEGLVDSQRDTSTTSTNEEVLDAPVEDVEDEEDTLGVDAEGGETEAAESFLNTDEEGNG